MGSSTIGTGARTDSLVVRGLTGTVRQIIATHRWDKLNRFSVINYQALRQEITYPARISLARQLTLEYTPAGGKPAVWLNNALLLVDDHEVVRSRLKGLA